jgi:hypothetical protein
MAISPRGRSRRDVLALSVAKFSYPILIYRVYSRHSTGYYSLLRDLKIYLVEIEM